jgi:hypothetical protein
MGIEVVADFPFMLRPSKHSELLATHSCQRRFSGLLEFWVSENMTPLLHYSITPLFQSRHLCQRSLCIDLRHAFAIPVI